MRGLCLVFLHLHYRRAEAQMSNAYGMSGPHIGRVCMDKCPPSRVAAAHVDGAVSSSDLLAAC